ncbi:MAG: hypothetical protein V1810_02245 [Candidatus Beckwithbacteria bacterium]
MPVNHELGVNEQPFDRVNLVIRDGLKATTMDLTATANQSLQEYFNREAEDRVFTQAVLITKEGKPWLAIIYGEGNLEIRGLDPKDKSIAVDPPFNQEGYVFTDEHGCFGSDISACLSLPSCVEGTGNVREAGTVVVAGQDGDIQVTPIPGAWSE